MPELAEVELARRQWAVCHGEQILEVACHRDTRIYRETPASQLKVLKGQTLQSSRCHGKRLLFTFKPDLHLEIHLGMTGKLYRVGRPHEPHKHDHFLMSSHRSTLAFSDYRQFGKVTLHQVHQPWDDLPIEILAPAFTTAYLREKVTRHGRKPLKAFLLDQGICPGVGNWMADEICWKLKHHPATPTSSIPVSPLRKALLAVCRGAIRHVADKNAEPLIQGFTPGTYVKQVPPRSWLFQHRWKAGGFCPRCQTELSRDTIASRTTAWCPVCQEPSSSSLE